MAREGTTWVLLILGLHSTLVVNPLLSLQFEFRTLREGNRYKGIKSRGQGPDGKSEGEEETVGVLESVIELGKEAPVLDDLPHASLPS